MAKIVGLTFSKKEHACPVCGKQFKSEAGLKQHVAKHDAGSNDPGSNDTGSNDPGSNDPGSNDTEE